MHPEIHHLLLIQVRPLLQLLPLAVVEQIVQVDRAADVLRIILPQVLLEHQVRVIRVDREYQLMQVAVVVELAQPEIQLRDKQAAPAVTDILGHILQQPTQVAVAAVLILHLVALVADQVAVVVDLGHLITAVLREHQVLAVAVAVDRKVPVVQLFLDQVDQV